MKTELETLRQLEREATNAPWTLVRNGGSVDEIKHGDDRYVYLPPQADGDSSYFSLADADLIVAMRNALPELLADAALGRAVREMKAFIETRICELNDTGDYPDKDIVGMAVAFEEMRDKLALLLDAPPPAKETS